MPANVFLLNSANRSVAPDATSARRGKSVKSATVLRRRRAATGPDMLPNMFATPAMAAMPMLTMLFALETSTSLGLSGTGNRSWSSSDSTILFLFKSSGNLPLLPPIAARGIEVGAQSLASVFTSGPVGPNKTLMSDGLNRDVRVSGCLFCFLPIDS